MAGAVDLSGIKQRAQQNAAASTDADRALSTPSGVTEITEANFEDEVIVRSDEVPVVVLLWSPRSEVCVDLLDTLSGLAAAAKGKWSLASVNVDVAPRVAQIFGVQAVPTVVALAAGQPISSFQGLQPADQLSRWVDSLLSATAGKLKGAASSEESTEVDPAVAQARQQLEDGDFVAARKSYQAILDANPGSVEAKAAIRQIEFLIRATAQRPDAVSVADSLSDDIDAAFAAADASPQPGCECGLRAPDRVGASDIWRRAHPGAHPADRAVRAVRPRRSRGRGRSAQPRQRAVLRPAGEQT